MSEWFNMKSNSRRCLPLRNWPDANARNQIINQIIFEEHAKNYDRSIWPNVASNRLKFYGIDIAGSTLTSYKYSIISGARSAEASSSFKGLQLWPRVGKGIMYGQLDLMVSSFLDCPKYVGLPANQIVHMIQKYNDHIVACEVDDNMFKFMSAVKEIFAPYSESTILKGDIFSYLEISNRKFSLYDFDLMKYMDDEYITKIADVISRTSERVSVINIASCVGRKIKDSQYRTIMPSLLIDQIRSKGYRILQNYSGGYSDRVTPMRYELLAIEKNSQ